MSSGLWLDVLLWLLSHATKVSVALNDLKAQDKDKHRAACLLAVTGRNGQALGRAPSGGHMEELTAAGRKGPS